MRKKFSAYSTLAPKHSAGKSYVKIKCYQKKSGKWRLRTTVKATTRNYNVVLALLGEVLAEGQGQLEARGELPRDRQVCVNDLQREVREGQVGPMVTCA